MQPILFVFSGFLPGSAANQALLAARGLLAKGWSIHAAGWGGPNFLTDELREAGAVVHDLGSSRLLEVERLRHLVELSRSIRPYATLAWGLPALRLAGLLPRRIIGRLLAADALPIAPSLFAGRRDLWLLRRAEKTIVSGRAEFDLARGLGLSETCLALLRPGIPDSIPETETSNPIATGRYLLCVGPLERSKGTHDAIWTLEILKYVFEDLHLVIAGAGPDRERLEDFARAIEAEGVVHFVGVRPNLASLYAGAAAVWVPSQGDRGARVALEAMHAGRPVVASRRPRLAEVVIDGETGFLTPVGDKVALAKQTRKLLDNPQLAEQMGLAGRRRVAEHFSFEQYMTSLQGHLG